MPVEPGLAAGPARALVSSQRARLTSAAAREAGGCARCQATPRTAASAGARPRSRAARRVPCPPTPSPSSPRRSHSPRADRRARNPGCRPSRPPRHWLRRGAGVRAAGRAARRGDAAAEARRPAAAAVRCRARAAGASRRRRAGCARPGCSVRGRARAQWSAMKSGCGTMSPSSSTTYSQRVRAMAALRMRPARKPSCGCQAWCTGNGADAAWRFTTGGRGARAVVGDDQFVRRLLPARATAARTRSSASGRSCVVTTRQQRVTSPRRTAGADPAARPRARRSRRRHGCARMSSTMPRACAAAAACFARHGLHGAFRVALPGLAEHTLREAAVRVVERLAQAVAGHGLPVSLDVEFLDAGAQPVEAELGARCRSRCGPRSPPRAGAAAPARRCRSRSRARRRRPCDARGPPGRRPRAARPRGGRRPRARAPAGHCGSAAASSRMPGRSRPTCASMPSEPR